MWPVWAALCLAMMQWRARSRATAHVREESCLGKGWGLCYSWNAVMKKAVFFFLACMISCHREQSLESSIFMTVKFECSRILGIVSEVIWVLVEVLLVNVSCIWKKVIISPQRTFNLWTKFWNRGRNYYCGGLCLSLCRGAVHKGCC